MHFSEAVSSKETTISGNTFVVPQPFTAAIFVDDALNGIGSPEVWANKMNQTLLEDLRNNFTTKIKANAKTEGAPALTQENFDAYIKVYEPGVRATGTTTSRDPIAAEALALAKTDLRIALREQRNLKVAKKDIEPTEAEVSFEKFLELAAGIVESHPEYTDKARIIVEARAGSTSSLQLDA